MHTIDIIGGGILGLTLGYSFIQRGVNVRIWERGSDLGGLMGRINFPELGGITVDRYYHAILSSDSALQQLIDELGLRSVMHDTTTKMGFYHAGKMYPMSSPVDFMLFPPLSLLDRVRLALTILRARKIRDWKPLEQQPVVDWLRQLGGDGPVEYIWKPLLRAKFDGKYDHVPATYIWSRLVRMTDTRDTKSAKETMCYLEGGYAMLIEALAHAIESQGGKIYRNTAVQQVVIEDGRVTGLQLADRIVASEGAVLTLQTPIARRLLPAHATDVAAQWSALDDYLGIVCMLLVLKRPLTPYYTLNITDERIPFTGVIETTNLIDPRYSGGHHLVYLPKYVAPDTPYATMDDTTLRADFLRHLRRMFPDLRDDEIVASVIGRERYVEPLHPIGQTDAIPPVLSDVIGLYLVNSAQIYPQLTNGEAAIRHARHTAEQIVFAQQFTGAATAHTP